MLTSIYLFNVIAIGYLVYALERRYGTCMIYLGNLELFFFDKNSNHQFRIENYQAVDRAPEFSLASSEGVI